MKVKIGGLELSDVSLDELDELVRRYGNGQANEGASETPRNENGTGSAPAQGVVADIVVLQKLVESGTMGVLATTLGTILGRKGKATRGAVRDWARRIGVSANTDDDPIEDCRLNGGTARGIRLKPALLDVGKTILEQRRGK